MALASHPIITGTIFYCADHRAEKSFHKVE